jgi:hypothetical protein
MPSFPVDGAHRQCDGRRLSEGVTPPDTSHRERPRRQTRQTRQSPRESVLGRGRASRFPQTAGGSGGVGGATSVWGGWRDRRVLARGMPEPVCHSRQISVRIT